MAALYFEKVKDALVETFFFFGKEATWLRLHDAECDGEGVMRQLDEWQLGRLDNENLSFHSVSLKHS